MIFRHVLLLFALTCTIAVACYIVFYAFKHKIADKMSYLIDRIPEQYVPLLFAVKHTLITIVIFVFSWRLSSAILSY